MTIDAPAKATRSAGGHPTTERAAEIGDAVVAATMQAFGDHGTDFSMDRVAGLAGVSKQAIYRRWKSKVDLVVDAIDRVLAVDIIGSDRQGGDPVALFRETAWRLFDTDLALTHRIGIFLQAEGFRNEPVRQRLIVWRGHFVDVYRSHLHDVERDGRRVAGNLSDQAAILMDLLTGAASALALSGTVSDDDKRHAFAIRWHAFCAIAIRDA